MKEKKDLILITSAFPFTLKESFIGMELPFLQKEFRKIIIIPLNKENQLATLPPGIEIISSFANKTGWNKIKRGLYALSSVHFYAELFKQRAKLKNLASIKYLMGNIGMALQLSSFLEAFITKRPELKNALFYSYWLHTHATALGFLKKRIPSLSVISRAHSYDIYEEENFPYFIPLRTHTFKNLDHVYSISEHGKGHLLKKYPQLKDKVTVNKLAVSNNFDNCSLKVNKNCYAFVSCSFLVPVKQVHLIIEGIAKVAKMYPHIIFNWTHLGSGPLFEKMKDLANAMFPQNVRWELKENLQAYEVMDYYKNHYIDLFLSASRVEGIPVSMMEALSFGIPIIGTNVGGVSELVNDKNGMLLSSNVTSEELVKAISTFISNPQKLISCRKHSFETWNLCFNSEKNFKSFAKNITSHSSN